jgi:hypothetical protein
LQVIREQEQQHERNSRKREKDHYYEATHKNSPRASYTFPACGTTLSRSNTSPEVVAGGQEKFEAEIAAALAPFV